MRVLRELALGARLGFAGRDGWLRAAMTAIGVGLGVALLLAAASMPAMLQARDDRNDARDDNHLLESPPRSDRTALIAAVDTAYGDRSIRGRAVRPDGENPPVPPGLRALPGPGEIVVSPALAALLDSPDGTVLRQRFPARITGTIGEAGLAGPRELAFYLGSDRLVDTDDAVRRIDRFGDHNRGEPLNAVLMLLIVVIFVVLLLPIAVFISDAMRFGSEHRDRRLAAMRLVGADSHMIRRIAVGEALVGAALGLALGAVLFLIGRRLVERITLMDISVFSTDLRPSPALAVLVALAVVGAAVVVTVLGLRRVVIEPLGVSRKAGGSRRRLWWRLLLPAVGLALLYPLFENVTRSGERANQYQVAAGVTLTLIGVATLLPWLVEAIVRRIGGGAVPWLLAVRRLQFDSGTAARVVSGIAVAAGGAIALQMLFADTQQGHTKRTGQDPDRAQLVVTQATAESGAGADVLAARFTDTPGVRSVTGFAGTWTVPAGTATQPDAALSPSQLVVGDCNSLRELAQLDRCSDGDSFVVTDPTAPTSSPARGDRLALHEPGGPQWTVPRTARVASTRPDPVGGRMAGVLLTPTAATGLPAHRPRITLYVQLDGPTSETVEQVRNTAARVSPLLAVSTVQITEEDRKFANIRRGLFAGAIVTLLLIGASMLVTALEQLRERRRLLAALVAFGTRRSTLTWSVLWQATVPMVLGIALAVGTGTGLGAALLTIVGRPIRVDWLTLVGVSGTAAAVVLLVTALSLPALWRLIRPEGLRTE